MGTGNTNIALNWKDLALLAQSGRWLRISTADDHHRPPGHPCRSSTRWGAPPRAQMTAQMHERLIIDGRTTSMAFCPTIPVGDGRVEELQVRDIVLQKDERLIFSTGCWRRYLGTWEIKDGLLFLNELKGRYRIRDSKPLHADWFTGVLRIPIGKLLHPVNMGFASVYEKELHIKIECGRVAASREIDNTEIPFDRDVLARENLPGHENRFRGDSDF